MNLAKVTFSAQTTDAPPSQNAQIITNLIKLGNDFGENVSISASTQSERREKLRAVLYGKKNPSHRHD